VSDLHPAIPISKEEILIQMSRFTSAAITSVFALLALCLSAEPVNAGVVLLGDGLVPGNATDFSGLTGNYAGNPAFPKDRLGAYGSAIAYTGHDNLYVMANDRGYADGTVDYNDRIQYFQIGVQVDPGNPNHAVVSPVLVDTKLLTNASGVNFTGFSGAFNPATYPAGALRLDAEGIRVGHNGELYISDEYGPYIYQFDQNGHQTGTIELPSKYSITNPSASADSELQNNNIGRQTNRGMEGLAISPDGRYLFGMMQNALLQDHALNGSFARVGLNNRIIRVDLQTGKTEEYVYQIQTAGVGTGTNEIVAINDHEFLVIERDNRTTTNATKSIYKIDINGATDVSNTGTDPSNGLPQGALPSGVMAVQKSLFLDIRSALNGAGLPIPEKIEGLSFGPDLADGRHLLFVTTDNDLGATNPSNIYAFAITPDALPGYVPQSFIPEPGSIVLVSSGILIATAIGWVKRRGLTRSSVA
jgi:hypothetical protein